MPKIWPVWSSKRLMKRWDCTPVELVSIIFHAIPAFRFQKGQYLEVRAEEIADCEPAKLDQIVFRAMDVQALESDPEFTAVMRRDMPIAPKDARELGQLREEKKKWDASILAAVQVGIHCSEIDGAITRDQLTDFILKIQDLPYTTIDIIWQALPDKYKKKAGRPKKK